MEIDFRKNDRLISIARLKKTFFKPALLTFLKVLIFLGLFGFIFLIFILMTGIGIQFELLAKILTFLFFVSLPQLFFVQSYFREKELVQKITNESNNLYESSSFEVISLLSEIDLNNPDLDKLFLRLLKVPRVRFISAELDFKGNIFSNIQTNLRNFNSALLFKKIIESTFYLARKEGGPRITSAHLFYGFTAALVNEPYLLAGGISFEDIENVVFWANNLFEKQEFPKTTIQKMKSSSSGVGHDWASGYTLDLNRFSQDISNPKIFGSFSIYGKKGALKQIENVLSKDIRNSCLITGPVGSGKTTTVYGLAEKIYWGDTLPQLAYKRIVSLDIAALLAGSQKEEIISRLISVFNDAVRAGNVILFIDDIHKLFIEGSEKTGTIDVSEVIIPYLNSIRIIGVTTDNYYHTYIQPKTQVSSAFEKIEILPTDKNETLKVLEDLSLYYSLKYRLTITYPAVKEIYDLADRFITNKEFPAKAVDLLDNICSAAKNAKLKVLTKEFAQGTIENMLNIPVREAGEKEKDTLIHLEEKLHQRVVGQDEAIVMVSNAMRVARTKVNKTKRPIGTFLFLGPTGVGKTELSKALAWAYFGDENNIIRMDMNGFQEISSIDRFIGRKISGAEELEGGEFVKKVREKPFSVVLLDEIEKAHPDILNLFLQILDEGYFVDGLGGKINFNNTIIIATSNAGASLIKDGIQSGRSLEDLKSDLISFVERENKFKPEFLNRFDGIVLFSPLSKENLIAIGKMMFGQIKKDLESQGYVIEIEREALEKIVILGYKPEFGAREIRRVFREKLEGFLAQKILKNELKKGELFQVKAADLVDKSVI